MKCTLPICALVAYAMAVAGQDLGVSDAMAARVDAQAWRVDRFTKQFQAISAKANDARADSKAGGDMAIYIMNALNMSDGCRRPNTRRCGKTPQCISVMAFCDGVNDCKNHYDEKPERCVMPFEVNTKWLGFPVYDHCWEGGSAIQYELRVTNVSSNNVIKGREVVMIDLPNVVIRGGIRQVLTFHAEAHYCKGSQRLIIQPFENQMLLNIAQFDGVYNDRFTDYIYHLTSGDKCAEYRVFKQTMGVGLDYESCGSPAGRSLQP